jgi:hypothetical protein
MNAHATQMALFSVLEPEPPKTDPPQPVGWGETIVVDPGPVGCASTRCKKPGVYLKGGFVLSTTPRLQAWACEGNLQARS